MKVDQRLADRDAVSADPKLADGVFVGTRPLFHDRDRPTHSPKSFEVTQQQNRIGQVGNIYGRFHLANQAMLCDREECCRSLSIEELKQLMHVEN